MNIKNANPVTQNKTAIQKPRKKGKQTVRVAFYKRVSTSEQDLEGYSPEFQQDQLLEHVQRKDYKGWYTKSDWHFYDAKSGGDTTNRTELQNLMELVRNKEVDLVLVWKIDRLSRKLSDLLDLFEEMDKYGVGFASMKEDLDFTGVIGKLIFQIFGALAEFERENIRMRTEEGKKASAKAGNYIGGAIPYGFQKVPNPKGQKGSKIKVVPSEAKIVKMIFDWFLFGDKTSTDLNYKQIARKLNKMGAPKGIENKRGQGTKWNDNGVKSILVGTEEYRGLYITNRYRNYKDEYGKEVREERPREDWITTTIEQAIIDDTIYFMAQEKAANIESLHSKRGGGQELYMLRGKLVDTQYNRRNFTGYKSAKGTRNYRRKAFTLPDGTKIQSMSIAAKELEEYVWKNVEEAINRPQHFLKLHKQQMEGGIRKKQLVEQLIVKEDLLSKANRRIEKVKDAYYDDDITEDERNDRLSKYESQRDDIVTEVKRLEEQIKQLGKYEIAVEHLKQFSEKFTKKVKSLTYAQKLKLVEMLVERIEIRDTETERVINACFRFDPAVISQQMQRVEPKNLKKRDQNDDSDAESGSENGNDDLNGGSGGDRTHGQ